MSRRVRWLVWIPVGILLLVLIVVVLALSSPVQTRVAHRLIASINRGIHGELAVGAVYVTLGGIVHVNDVVLKDPEGNTVASFSSLKGHVDLWGLRRRTVRIYALDIDSLQFDMAMDTTGKSNLERALAPKDTTKPPPDTTKRAAWVLRLDNIIIRGGPGWIHNPADTLLHTDNFTLKADAAFKERKLDYRVEYDSPKQVYVKTEGKGLLGDTLTGVEGKVTLRVDSTYTGGYYLPARTVGRTVAEMSYKQRSDSMDLDADIQSNLMGHLRGTATMMFPPGKIAGHGVFAFDGLKPASLWHDTTALEISGTVAFDKDSSLSKLNGWDVHLKCHDTRYAAYRISEADLHIVTKDSTARVNGDVDLGRGRMAVNAFMNEFDPKRMDIEANVHLANVKLHDYVSQVPNSLSPVTGVINVRGQNVASTPNRQISATAYLHSFTFGQYQVDTLAVRGAVNGDHVLVDTLSVRGYGLSVEGEAEGQMHGDVGYAVKADIPDMGDLEPLLKAVSDSLDTLRGSISLDVDGVADLSGSLANLTAEGDIELADASYGRNYVRNADIRLTRFEKRGMSFGAAMLADSLVVAGRHIDSVDVKIDGTMQNFTTAFQAWSQTDSMYVGAALTAQFGGPMTTITLDTLHAIAYGLEAVSETPSTLVFSKERFEVDGVEIRSDAGVLRASGYMQRHGEQDISVEVSGLKTGVVAKSFKLPLPESTANIRVQFTGTDANLVGDMSLVADSIVNGRKLLADQLVVEATADNKETVINGMVSMHGDTSVVFGGSAPLQISFASGVVLRKDDPISGQVRIIKQRLAGFGQFLSSGTSVDGIIMGDATFKGTPNHPEWAGTFTIQDAFYRDRRTGVNYRDIDLQGELVGDSLRIPQISMRSVGRLTGGGSAVMAFPLPKDLDVKLHMNRFEVMNSPQMRIRASGDINLSGPLNQLHTQGDLKFDEIIYRVSEGQSKSLEEVNLDSVMAVMRGDTAGAKESPFSPTAIYRSMSSELHLTIPGNCWVRGSGMNIELGGELWMYKDNGVDPTINGSIQTKQGKVVVLGKRFEVQSGQITFEGPIGDPQIDIVAEYKPPEQASATQSLRVHVYGTVKETRMEFEGMTPEEAVTALLGSGTGSASTTQLVERTATGAATGQLTSFIGKWAGLDVFEYRPGSADGSLTGGTLEVGSYVTDRLFVRVKQPVESGDAAATDQTGRVVNVEYRLLDWLKLRAEQETRGGAALDLLLQFDWR